MVNLSLAEKRLLAALPADGSPASLDQVVADAGFAAPVEALRAASGPERHELVALVEQTKELFALSDEGLAYRENGLPERRALAAIRAAGGRLPMGELASAAGLDKPEVPVAIGWLKRKGWAAMEKGDGGTALVLAGDAVAGEPEKGDDEVVLDSLSDLPAPCTDEPGLKLLGERKGILVRREDTTRSIRLTPQGREHAAGLAGADLAGAEEVNQITPELVARWAEMTPEEKALVELRPFDFDVPVAPRYPGKTHPLTQMMTSIREIFWSMGFSEIAGDYVESAFWNMDALFIPQDHPARDMQDTFYLEQPASLPVDEEALARGKAVHLDGGGTGSTGWGGSFDEDVSRRALLRTHTTNTTIRYLAEHFGAAANPETQATHTAQGAQAAHKVFGLGKVFRKETMDATHLPEFYQIEGIVTEPGASFNTLVGLCREFFTRMGFPEVRFRPAYFPYTEPSMEIDVMYRGKWMELGGCGVFRPEVTEPLDVPHPVLAWGFGLERLAMMRLGLKDIRQLYVSDLQWLKDTPLQ